MLPNLSKTVGGSISGLNFRHRRCVKPEFARLRKGWFELAHWTGEPAFRIAAFFGRRGLKGHLSNGYQSFGRGIQNWRRTVDRTEKQELVSSLRDTFEQSAIVVVTHYKGLSVTEMDELRGQMREAGALFKVTKNRLTRLALEGTQYEGLTDLFTGPTAIAYSEDPVAAAKVTAAFSKKNEKLVILGGSLGTEALDVDGVKALATLPSLDELRAKIVGMINTPATRIAGIMQAPAGQLARVMGAKAAQGEAA